MNDENNNGRPVLMMTTPGVTAKRLAAEPLATEAEATAGPNDANPWRSPEEREIVEEARRREEEARDDQAFKTGTNDGGDTGGVDHPLQTNTVADPTSGDDPFVFDDLGPGTFDLPSFDPLEHNGSMLPIFESGQNGANDRRDDRHPWY